MPNAESFYTPFSRWKIQKSSLKGIKAAKIEKKNVITFEIHIFASFTVIAPYVGHLKQIIEQNLTEIRYTFTVYNFMLRYICLYVFSHYALYINSTLVN